MPDYITAGPYNEIEGAQEHLEDAEYAVMRGGSRMALCDTLELAQQVAALLCFQSAMTEEMWEGAIATLSEEHGSDRDEPACPSCKALAALDTLRQELQTP